MRTIFMIPAAIAALVAGSASAQLPGGSAGVVGGATGNVGGYSGTVAGGQMGTGVGGTLDSSVGTNGRTVTSPSTTTRSRGSVNGSAAATPPGRVGTVQPSPPLGAPPPAAGVTGEGQATVTTPTATPPPQ